MSRSISGANSGLVRYYLLKTDEAVQVAENLLEVQYIDLAVSQERAFAENRWSGPDCWKPFMVQYIFIENGQGAARQGNFLFFITPY